MDTPSTEFLPVLYLEPLSLANPGIITDYYAGWAGGNVAISSPIQGCALTSLATADAICAARFGAGWRMGEHHDGAGAGAGGPTGASVRRRRSTSGRTSTISRQTAGIEGLPEFTPRTQLARGIRGR